MADDFSELEVFVRVVELGGFSRAASRLRLTPSGVSRIVTRLEDRVGVRLLNRTTRSLSLTQEGAEYFERGTKILADLQDAHAALAKVSARPRGRLRVDLPNIFADFVVGPALPGFLARYPELEIDLMVRDRLVDLVSEGTDVALRLAPPRDSELVARKLGAVRALLVASPAYLTKHGRPETPRDLLDHACIPYLSVQGVIPWRFRGPDGEISMMMSGRLQAGAGSMLTQAAVGGLGITHTYEPHVAAQLRRGELEVVLPDFEPDPRPVHALFAKRKAELPRVRVFLDFCAALFAGQRKRGR